MPDAIGRLGAADDTSNTEQSAEKATAFLETVPEAFRDKPYMEDIKSMSDLMTKFDGAEVLIGQNRVVIPGEDATPEVMGEFYKTLGRPESADKYTTSFTEGADVKVFDGLKGVFHAAGLTQKQVDAVVSGSNDVFKTMNAAVQNTDAARDLEFDKMSLSVFGTEQQAATDTANKLINQFASEKVRPFVNDLPNKSLLVLADVLGSMSKKYMQEDYSVLHDTGQISGEGTLSELKAKANKVLVKAMDETKYNVSERKEFTDQADKLFRKVTEFENKHKS